MANTNTGNQQKKVYTTNDLVNLGQQAYDAVDEQAILNKYNQATAAQFAAQQDQNRVAENNFYNQMYNTQKTAMDTIRQSNANAVSTGASRGVQAANELSALLGLQQESIASATEIANARRQTAQEETAAMLQNIVQASQDAAAQRQQALQSMIQAQSLKATEDQAAATRAQTDRANKDALQSALKESPEAYTLELVNQNKIGPEGTYTTAYTPEMYTIIDNIFVKGPTTHKTKMSTENVRASLEQLGISVSDIQEYYANIPPNRMVIGTSITAKDIAEHPELYHNVIGDMNKLFGYTAMPYVADDIKNIYTYKFNKTSANTTK